MAYQHGGTVENLKKILPDEIGPNFVGAKCNMTTEMDKCLDAASDLAEYAYKAFEHTFDGPNPHVVPLGIGFTHWDSIKKLGLKPPPAIVTPESNLGRR